MILSFLRNTLFRNKVEWESRDLEFLVPLDALGLSSYGVSAMSLLFWIQLLTIVLLESILNVAVALTIYKFVIQRRETLSSFLVGYGVVLPILLYVPFALCNSLDLRNATIIMSAAAGPQLLVFRCLEAMHGRIPEFASKSAGRYALYFASTVQFEFDPDTHEAVPFTAKRAVSKTTKTTRLFLEASILYSILLPYDFSVFPRRTIRHPLDLFHWGNIANNWIMAYLTSICLEVGSDGIGLATSLLSGISTIQLNFSPMTRSACPSEFWGRRWNVLVSSALKRGVFVPFRIYGFGRPVAAMATFVASGLLHEYLITVMTTIIFRENGRIPPKSVGLYGKHLLFFVWNAVVLILEVPLKDARPVRWISRNVPALVKTQLVILTVLPLAHLFTDVYVDIGLYSDFAVGFPLVRTLK